MTQLIADRNDIDFLLHGQFDLDPLLGHGPYAGLNGKTIDLIITEARNFGLKEVLPTYVQGDREGVVLENGQVRVPECFHRLFALFKEGEWTALVGEPEKGGQGLPQVVALAAAEYLIGPNYPFGLYVMAGFAAGEMIQKFGTPDQRELFVEKMYRGIWGGTMVLTEPHAGSDVGALTTRAVKNPDGTYDIIGEKIFISSGDHDLTENIIHPVLARIEGAPAGTRGISCFIVPKIWVNPDGSLGEFNHVACTGVEDKMGIHASSTCSLSFGSGGRCRGFLLGQENKGMRVMFHMMNEARIMVGSIGHMSASAAYLYALDYARKRFQGRALENIFNPDAPQVPIIDHPDVRRMLMWMKAHVEGMRSLVYYTALCHDLSQTAQEPEFKEKMAGFVDLLTPVVKSYLSDKGFDVCVLAMQVMGGYGYMRDYPVEQILRDVKIASIYEGTNGIQAMDLLGRKLAMNQGRLFADFLGEMNKTVDQAKKIPALADLAEKTGRAVTRLGETAAHLGNTALTKNLRAAFSFASPFLDAFGDVLLAWMLLWRAETGARLMEKSSKKSDFYQGQIHTAQYFIQSILPITLGKMEAIKNADNAAVAMDEKGFGG